MHIPFWFKKVLLLTFGVFLLPASCFLYPLSKFLRIRSKGPCLYIFYRFVFYFYMRFCSNIFDFVPICDIIFSTIFSKLDEVKSMTPIFDLDKLRSLLQDFYILAKIRISIFDAEFHELVAYPEEIPTFCRLVRSSSQGFDACAQCDQTACATATACRKTYIYTCHAGLTEVVAPLYIEDVLIGYIFLGHIFSYPMLDTGLSVIRNRCRHLPVDIDRLFTACKELPQCSPEYVRSATQIFHAVASYLILERIAVLREESLSSQLKKYVSIHYTDEEKVNVATLCHELNISKTQLYRLSKEVYNCGIAQQIRKMRIDLAKSMLSESARTPISEVAAACGYSDYNYFITVFSREVGCPPGAYRRSLSHPPSN